MIRFSILLMAAVIAGPAFAETLAIFPSPDKKLTARIERGEGDWRSIDIVDTATGQKRDRLDWAAFTRVVRASIIRACPRRRL